MGCHIFGNERARCRVTVADIYEYKGILFEIHPGGGPICLKKDMSQAKRVSKGFYDAVTEFDKLPKKKQEKYLVMS
jgi:hypothetical protein